MIETLKQWGRGLLLSILAMAIFAISLGCCIALILLVVSMEEGGDNLSAHTVPLTQAVVLLSQGIGFTTSSITLTIMPLGLTMLLVALIVSLIKRMRAASPHALAAGLVGWLVLNAMLRQGVEVGLTDALGLSLLKCAGLYAFAVICAACASTRVREGVAQFVRDHLSAPIRHCLACSLALAGILLGVYTLCAIGTVIAWIWMNHDTMGTVFEMAGMQTGSRVLTTIASLIWLPNLCVWACSWLFGAGFAIGELGTFTLWVGQSSGLPAIPIFGLFPDPVENDVLRTLVQTIPMITALVLGLLVVFLPRGFAYRPMRMMHERTDKRMVLDLVYPAAAFCLAGALVAVCSAAVFALSNGSLGEHRLAHVGVDVVQSTQSVGRPTAIGLFAAWMTALVVTAAFFGIGWISRRVSQTRDTHRPPRTAAVARTACGTTDASASGQSTDLQPSDSQPKEEQDDKHEPTDSPSTGIGLP
ncbi:cell division protein PerM [Bifidobacterium eulemuris]|uniref:Uncharacterized protein n=1 Tax=Bifidobacterium eulemuris TaxID=1765219 RepID=A0A261GCK9_9BIFI|nr:DUF6350 family protein [Bifidobacterium eulemuris]OZG69157.1 hypothetical protein BEUL_0563 [Bifidobacterium eulemuris]QOL31328.1 hypothetical protein BE0216_01785 [Bifidobacterium eulemuris]